MSMLMTGVVKWFDDSKGFGFIEQNNGPDIFVHYSGIIGQGRRTLLNGQSVSFELVQGQKGPHATKVSAQA